MPKKYSVSFHAVLLLVALIHAPSLRALNPETHRDSTLEIQPLPKGVSIHQLSNGMRVLLIQNPALPMVGVNVAVKVGSAYETFSTSGMSHMLEHLLFNGTTSRTQKQLYDDVDRVGGYNNAHTDNFYTDYMMVTPAENIGKGMEIQADMLFNSTLPLDKFEKEKGIVLEEISKSLANPQEQLERNTLSILYDGHALSLPTLGTYSTIQFLSRDNVNSFYKNNYVPNNMILSVIGNFQSTAMLAQIKEVYGKARPGQVHREEDPEWATGFQAPKVQAVSGERVYNRFYDGEDKVIQVFYRLPQARSAEYFHLLGLVFEKNKEAIQSSLKPEFPQSVKSFKLSARQSHLKNFAEATVILAKDADLAALVNSISSKLSNLNFTLPTETVESEVTKARTEFVKNIEKPHMFGIYNSELLVVDGIDGVLSSFSGKGFYSAAKELGTLSLASHQVIIIQSPSVKKEKETAEATRNLEMFDSDTSGKHLIVVQNEASNLLAIHYLVKHKAVFESIYGKDASKILHDCLDQRLKSEANQKACGRHGFTFTVNDNPFIPMDDIYLHPDFGYIRAEGLADDVSGAIGFLNGQLKNFVPTESEFKKAVEKFKGIEMMAMGGDKSKKLFDEAYKSLVYEPDAYTKNQPALTYDNLVAFTKEYFAPSNMIVSVVSPAKPGIVSTFFDQFSAPPDKKEATLFIPTFVTPDKATTVEKAGGGGERSYIFWGFISQVDPKDAPALQALSLVLSDRIVFDIREKQGMAYNMNAGVEVIRDKALFFVSQGTRPQNIDKLSPQYPRFFQMKAIDTLSQNELEKSINMYLGRMMFRRLSSINQAYYLGNSLYFHNDVNYDRQFLEEVKKATLADVKGAARKYMTIKNPILLIVR